MTRKISVISAMQLNFHLEPSTQIIAAFEPKESVKDISIMLSDPEPCKTKNLVIITLSSILIRSALSLQPDCITNVQHTNKVNISAAEGPFHAFSNKIKNDLDSNQMTEVHNLTEGKTVTENIRAQSNLLIFIKKKRNFYTD
ncbi:hypothetical protein ACTXT7_014026 [Hymenolepis weldensis]